MHGEHADVRTSALRAATLARIQPRCGRIRMCSFRREPDALIWPMCGLGYDTGRSARSTSSLRLVRTDAYRDVAEAAWAWVLDHVRELDGPWLPESVTDDWEAGGPAADRDSLYAGLAGLARYWQRSPFRAR